MNWSIAFATVCGIATLSLAPHLQPLPEFAADEEASEVRLSPGVLRAASAGYEAALADWYWLGGIQYFGTRSNGVEHYRRLKGYLEAATDLDPDFGYAYIFGGYALPQKIGSDKEWHNINTTIQLLQKGMASGSTRWEIPYLLGYNLFTFKGDYLGAAHYIQIASGRPKAPGYLLTFVGTLTAQGHGNLQAAIDFTQGALDNAPEHWTHDDLEERLRALRLQQSLDRLNEAARSRQAAGLPLSSVQELVGYGEIRELPEDPYGGSFRLEDGRVVSSHTDKLLHVFLSPGAPPTQPYAD